MNDRMLVDLRDLCERSIQRRKYRTPGQYKSNKHERSLTFQIDDPLYFRLYVYAAQHSTTMADVIRTLVANLELPEELLKIPPDLYAEIVGKRGRYDAESVRAGVSVQVTPAEIEQDLGVPQIEHKLVDKGGYLDLAPDDPLAKRPDESMAAYLDRMSQLQKSGK